MTVRAAMARRTAPRRTTAAGQRGVLLLASLALLLALSICLCLAPQAARADVAKPFGDRIAVNYDPADAQRAQRQATTTSSEEPEDDDEEDGEESSKEEEQTEHNYDPKAFYEAMLTPDHLKNHIVYVADEHRDSWAHGDSIVVEGAMASEEDAAEGGRLHKRDPALENLDAPKRPRRVIRAVAGCSSPASFSVAPLQLDNGNPFTLTINNLPATGIDFGDGNPQYFAFWNASILDINQGKTTTLTTVTDTPVETSGVAFDGCFKTVKVTDVLTATLTQVGATATITPNVTGRYFIDLTASPGLKSTRIAFQVTTTPYKFTPPPGYVPPPISTPTIPEPTPRECPGNPVMLASGSKGAAIYSNVKRGSPVSVTLSGVPERIISSTKGMKKTTWQATYKAGEIVTVSYTLSTSGTKTVSDLKHPISKTIAAGKMVTYRRVVATPINEAFDGCIDKLVDDKNWVVPKNLGSDGGVMNLNAQVNGLKVAGIAMLEGVSTSVIPPYPTNKPIPPKPTSIVNTKTLCSDFYAVVVPSTVTPGATMTVQLYNIPATPISLVSKGWSTVYAATYAPTIISNQMAITTMPSATFRTTMFTPDCVNATVTVVATATRKVLPLTAAPSPTPVYQIVVNARNYSNIPDGKLPFEQRRQQARAQIFMVRGPDTPENIMIKEHPCFLGPITVKSKITYDAKKVLAKFYSLSYKRYQAGAKSKRSVNGFAKEEGEASLEDIEAGEEEEEIDTVAEAQARIELEKRGLTAGKRPTPVAAPKPKPGGPPTTPLSPGEIDLTTLTIRLGNGSGVVNFNVRDKIAGKVDMYSQDLTTLPMPSDWSFEWSASGKLVGRIMPPFTITSTYSINSALNEDGSVADNPKPKIVLTHAVTVQPWWGESAVRYAGIPTTPKPTVRFNVTSSTYGDVSKFSMTCPHPYAKPSAFTAMIFGTILDSKASTDAFTAKTQKTTWTLDTSTKGAFVVKNRPVFMPRYLGPISEVMERFAIDYGSNGRDGEPNPNAPPGSPTQNELQKDLDSFKSF